MNSGRTRSRRPRAPIQGSRRQAEAGTPGLGKNFSGSCEIVRDRVVSCGIVRYRAVSCGIV
eukprot:6881354-Prymnesium_polylepis.1